MHIEINPRGRRAGFTLVEVLVTLVVLAILSGVIIVGFGNWREDTAETEVSSSLSDVALAMKNHQNFKNSFPSGLPNSFKQPPGAEVSYASGDDNSYCINSVSRSISSVKMYVTETGEIKNGTCP
ncbi:prepilin-type N-terminal cleavage/methylation domain-containing protein [Candidatus Nomurabacteria bacterium]|nr:prepilin-type N-terminal cleavage/methylation domain-containing protein [Candidatus Nomurabacteria bacterium]